MNNVLNCCNVIANLKRECWELSPTTVPTDIQIQLLWTLQRQIKNGLGGHITNQLFDDLT